MGQQTQASRIEQFLPRFLTTFPTIRSLALAKKSDVIKAWQGLGYNRRALNLQKAAQELYAKPFPTHEIELLALPGIGPYTAKAIVIFAFNKPVVTIDVNVERVLSRIYKKMPSPDAMLTKEKVYQIAELLLPSKNSRVWHEALMDLGATICVKRNPKCDTCPLFSNCKTRGAFAADNVKLISSEKLYFSHPKRIWRGKVLKIIANNTTTSEPMLIRSLQKSYPPTAFSKFIHTVIEELVREGFCESKKNTYRLLK
jgi:A/G-specific adenine glycosylase